MNGTWYGESNDLLGYAEDISDYYNPEAEGEDDSGEDYAMTPEMAEANNDRVRRARAIKAQRARAVAKMARQRGLPPSRRYLPPTPTAKQPATTGLVSKGFERVGTDVQKINATVQSVDLESKLQADMLASSLKAQQQRITHTQYAAAGAILAGIATEFSAIKENAVVAPLIKAAPALFLKPAGKAPIYQDMRVVIPVAVLALEVFKHFQDKVEEPAEVTLGTTSLVLQAGKSVQLTAFARGQSGKIVSGRSFDWQSLDDSVATVDSAGRVTAVGSGSATIIATETVTKLQATATVTATSGPKGVALPAKHDGGAARTGKGEASAPVA